MRTDIDYIISLMKEYTPKTEGELGEQEETPASGPTSTSTDGYPTVSKWSEVVGGPARGKANPLGLSSEKWTDGVTRGVANQLT